MFTVDLKQQSNKQQPVDVVSFGQLDPDDDDSSLSVTNNIVKLMVVWTTRPWSPRPQMSLGPFLLANP